MNMKPDFKSNPLKPEKSWAESSGLGLIKERLKIHAVSHYEIKKVNQIRSAGCKSGLLQQLQKGMVAMVAAELSPINPKTLKPLNPKPQTLNPKP